MTQHYPNRKPRSWHGEFKLPSGSPVIKDASEEKPLESPSTRLAENIDSDVIQQSELDQMYDTKQDRLYNENDFDRFYEYVMKNSLQTPEEREEGRNCRKSHYTHGLYMAARQAIYGRLQAAKKLAALEAQKRRGGVPLIWRWNIGHYGGYYVSVPAENLEEFKSRLPKGTFPKNVEKEPAADTSPRMYLDTVAEAFDKLYPKSKGVKYRVFFGDRSKGTRFLSDSMMLQYESAEQPDSYD